MSPEETSEISKKGSVYDMNIYFKNFLHRGLIFGGFGPVILGIVYFFIERFLDGFSLSGNEVLLGIVSTYSLAFVQAGASVFNQIEHWSLPKSLLCHFGSLYIIYVICYLLNSWIPFRVEIVIIFTAIFVVLYFAIWLTVYFSVRSFSKKINKRLT
ncbi:MAG: DUF3021 domain-containing protein [Clostridia bacterium]|nr:DUF3021 domain-containing protein [Clostridia bacterium]